MSKFYILSLKHSPSPQGYAVWWRPNCAGYTTSLADAGVYDADEVESDDDYYSNGKTTEAWHKDAVDKLARGINFGQLQEHHRAHMAGLLWERKTHEETVLHDISQRWDGGVHNRPGDEHNPEGRR